VRKAGEPGKKKPTKSGRPTAAHDITLNFLFLHEKRFRGRGVDIYQQVSLSFFLLPEGGLGFEAVAGLLALAELFFLLLALLFL
jgi:hypothetical protein